MMKEKIRYGKVTQAEEFLFPDSELGVLPDKLRLAAAKNGRRGIQLLLPTLGEKAVCTLSSGDFTAEWYGMRAVPVEYNTGNGVAQGGGMVLMDPVEEKPPYAIRKAPFQVYDCLMPRPEGVVEAKDGRAAIYLCLVPGENIREGTCQAEVRVALEEGECRLLLEIEVYGVRIPEEEFQITNWFSIPAICRFHKTGQGEPAFWEVLKKYIALMRRARQTCFYIQLDKACVAGTDPYRFDFSYLKEMISLFFDSGMKYLEIGPLLSRGFREDGSPDMFTGAFRCMAAPEVDLDSWEGYEITVRFIRALADFLRENGWDDKVMVHIHDEPDIHVDSEKTLESRKRQYYLTASILRKYLPRVRIIEAVSTSGFRGGIDIWVPGTAGYEADREGFLRLTDLGEEVWNYVCCGPQGFWLNRFLDFALIKNRLLFPTMKTLEPKRAENKAEKAAVNGSAEAATVSAPSVQIDLSKVKIEPLFADDVDFETFSKSDFRVVKIEACEAVPKSKKLLKFTLNDGTDRKRTILSGIHEYYEPEELVGKTCVAITNLPPRKMMGIDSEGMLISAVYEYDGREGLNLLMLDDSIPAGAKLY